MLTRLSPPFPISSIATKQLKFPKHEQNVCNGETINHVCHTWAAGSFTSVHPVQGDRGCTHFTRLTGNLHVPEAAACISIDDKSLFGRLIYSTHSLIYVNKKKLKPVNPRHFYLQPISKIPVQFWRSQYFIVDWKNLCKREK